MFKTGDKVRVKSKTEIDRLQRSEGTTTRARYYCGQEFTILKYDYTPGGKLRYIVDVNIAHNSWMAWAFEPAELTKDSLSRKLLSDNCI